MPRKRNMASVFHADLFIAIKKDIMHTKERVSFIWKKFQTAEPKRCVFRAKIMVVSDAMPGRIPESQRKRYKRMSKLNDAREFRA
jgi:hypothetical protein